MKATITILTLLFTLTVFNSSGQTNRKDRKYLEYSGNVADLKVCFDCDFNIIVKAIRHRIKDYPVDSTKEFRRVKADTLIEIVEFDKFEVDYSFYFNNLLKIKFVESSKDTNDYVLQIMNENEITQKEWNISPNRHDYTEYDEFGLKKYFAEIYPDNESKIEFFKEWKNGKFTTGISKIFKKENNAWKIQKIENVGAFDWPDTLKGNIGTIDGFTNLQNINLAHHFGNFDRTNCKYLEINLDSLLSFLPYRLKQNLETGTYKIYKYISKKWVMTDLLIDANIYQGQLDGVYNEYDINNGKIKIYCIYKSGKLDGRRTIYYYDNKGEFSNKITELWDNGKYISRVY